MANPYEAELKWLISYDLRIHRDITTDCNCEDIYCEHIYSIYQLQSFDDPSVGLFPEIYSPWFKSLELLLQFIRENRLDLEKKIEESL